MATVYPPNFKVKTPAEIRALRARDRADAARPEHVAWRAAKRRLIEAWPRRMKEIRGFVFGGIGFENPVPATDAEAAARLAEFDARRIESHDAFSAACDRAGSSFPSTPDHLAAFEAMKSAARDHGYLSDLLRGRADHVERVRQARARLARKAKKERERVARELEKGILS